VTISGSSLQSVWDTTRDLKRRMKQERTRVGRSNWKRNGHSVRNSTVDSFWSGRHQVTNHLPPRYSLWLASRQLLVRFWQILSKCWFSVIPRVLDCSTLFRREQTKPVAFRPTKPTWLLCLPPAWVEITETDFTLIPPISIDYYCRL